MTVIAFLIIAFFAALAAAIPRPEPYGKTPRHKESK